MVTGGTVDDQGASPRLHVELSHEFQARNV